MSTSTVDSGGGGGGDSTTDTTTDDTTTDDGGGGGGGGSDDDGLSASQVADIVRSILPGWVLNPPRALRAFIERPVATVTTIVVGFVFQDIVLPIVRGILEAGLALVGAVLFLAQSIAMIGDALISALVGGFAPVGMTLLRTIGQFNRAIAQAAATGGLAAPTIVTLLWGVQLGVAGFFVVSLIESVDVPFVDLGGILRAVTAPVKFVVGLVR